MEKEKVKEKIYRASKKGVEVGFVKNLKRACELAGVNYQKANKAMQMMRCPVDRKRTGYRANGFLDANGGGVERVFFAA